MQVTPLPIGPTRVFCAECFATAKGERQMTPVEYRPIDGGRTWLFWRCLGNPDHVTAAVPRA